MSNNRKSQRYSCEVPIEGKKGSVFDQTQSVDFSKNGIGFISRHRIPVNKEIPIEIDLSPEGKPVFVVGRVQWVHRLKDSKSYRIGLTFKDVYRGSKSQLNQYFQELQEIKKLGHS